MKDSEVLRHQADISSSSQQTQSEGAATKQGGEKLEEKAPKLVKPSKVRPKHSFCSHSYLLYSKGVT